MKKILTKFFAIGIMCCTMFAITGCGNKEKNMGRVYGGLEYDSKEEKSLNKEEAIAFIAEIKNANPNPTTLSLTNGIRSNYNVLGLVGGYQVEGFDIYLQEINDVLISQGKYGLKTEGSTAYEPDIEVNFYHDGTYLGQAIKQNGKTDKQKEELPLANIGYMINNTKYINDLLELLNNVPNIDEIPTDAGFDIITYKGTNCICEDFIEIEYRDYIMETSENIIYSVYLDMSYNIIGFYKFSFFSDDSDSDVRIGAEITNKKVTMPSDFADWTIRPTA